MKVFIPARFSDDSENKRAVDALCKAVREAKMEPFCFVRDVQHYKDTLGSEKKLWGRIYDELGACEALLIDASDHPDNGRLVEVGIAYALRKTVIVVKKQGVKHEHFFDGVSSKIIEYKDYSDLSEQLAKYDIDRNYNLTDKMTLLLMFLLLGGAIIWACMQVFIPLAPVAAVAYWFVIRKFSETARTFDRIVIYIPLAAVWYAAFAWLYPGNTTLALGWTAGYWLLVLALLRKFKFSL